jgi:hypothetical protein
MLVWPVRFSGADWLKFLLIVRGARPPPAWIEDSVSQSNTKIWQ